MSLVPGDRPPQLCRESDDLAPHGFAHLLSSRPLDLEQHDEPRRPLDQCGYAGVIRSHDQVALPVARNRTVLDLGWALGNHDHPGDQPGPRSAGAVWSDAWHGRFVVMVQLAAQFASGLDEERQVNGLVAHVHLGIVGIGTSQPPRYLLGRPFEGQFLGHLPTQSRTPGEFALLGPTGLVPRPSICRRRPIAL